MHADRVVLDGLGYLPFSQAGSALLFQRIRELPLQEQFNPTAKGTPNRKISTT